MNTVSFRIKDQDDARLPQADRDFEAAVRVLDFPEIENALAAGADPNRPFTDQWHESDGFRAMWFLGESFGRHLLDASGRVGNFGQSHASAMRALVEAGADFSLPVVVSRLSRSHPFTAASSGVSFSDRGSNLWESEALPIESCVWFAKGRGSMSQVFGGNSLSRCSAADSRTMRRGPAEDVLGPMWDVAIKQALAPKGASLLLSKILGQGLLEWSKWLIAKGATLAPISLSGGVLRSLALEIVFDGHPSKSGHCPWGVDDATFLLAKQQMEREVHECARLAVALGEDVDDARGGASPVLLSLLEQGSKQDLAASLKFANTLLELGAKPLAGHAGKPFLAYALSGPACALEQLDFALAAGADPKDRPRQAVFSLLNRAFPQQDKAVVQVVQKLVALGADLSQPASEPAGSSLLAAASANGLWGAANALAAVGCDPRWKDAGTGETLISLAAGWSAIHGRVGGAGCSQALVSWLSSTGAPMDEPGHGGFTALHRAAKTLDFKLCEALLSAGADANRPTANGAAMTPAHLACSRFDKKKEKAQLATMEALSRHGADFSKVDGNGRSAMEIASKNSALSVVMAVAHKTGGSAFAGEAGARASKVLGARGESFLSVVESSELESSTAPAASADAPKRARRAL